MEEAISPFFIGHHDDRRPLPITSQSVQDAHAANYDMLTSPITTPHFHSRVLTLLSTYLADSSPSSASDLASSNNASPVVVPPLTPVDSPLTPNDTTGQLIGVTSSWIDLCSPDPIISDVSRQVLKLELAYAAFCGLIYVVIPGPRLGGLDGNESGLVQYARAILDGLALGPFMQLYIWLPIIDHSDDDKEEMGDLNPFTRHDFTTQSDRNQRLDLFGSWEAWNAIRSLCKYPSRLFVALRLPKLLPPVAIQSRWYSEPVRLLTLDESVFSKNPKGYPVLSKAHQAFISRFVRLRNPPWFLLCNCGPIPASTNGNMENMSPVAFPTPAESFLNPSLKDPTPQLSYMRNLQSKQPPLAPIDRFGAGYQDFLQAPLQPLSVNLESITYEVFEKDPVKYDWYERAIARALNDWVEQGKHTSNPDGRVVVAVVGAGRGPLVTRALKASEDVGVEIDMWALEKNPNAFVLLQRHNESIWNRRVNLVKSDMRTWRGPVRQANAKHISQIYNKLPEDEADTDIDPPPVPTATFTGSPETDSTYLLATATHQATFYKIDILISELLGSFADNELSPECLDGVQHLLNPVHGISIPASYTAFISPISAPKLYADINNSMLLNTPNAQEIPYVVMLNAIDHVSTTSSSNSSITSPGSPAQSHSQSSSGANHRPQQSTGSMIPSPPKPVITPTWSFHHPNPSLPAPSPTPTNTHNNRFSSTSYHIANRSTIHGLAGYFETVLYPGVELSTNPLTMDAKSEGMISWFPIYFPLKSALYTPDDSEAQVCMWRKTDERKVWYEWQVDIFISADSVGGGVKGIGGIKGKKVRIGGSELHSSEKEGCLM